MQYILQHIQSIISEYNGTLPLTHFLKQYYKRFPKLGSRDRKALSEAIYLYYRWVKFSALKSDQNVFNIIAWAIQKSGSENKVLKKLFTIEEYPAPDVITDVQNNIPKLSSDIDFISWGNSLLRQPLLFIRLRNDIDKYRRIFIEAELDFQELDYHCFSFPNGTKIENYVAEADYVVQDYSSQRSIYKVLPYLKTNEQTQHIWDVCSGAGGKSILLKDYLPNSYILATDIRESILYNLRLRAKQYGLKGITTQMLNSSDTLDVSKKITQHKDVIICDVPCSGSGTWARTPEQFAFFNQEQLIALNELQAKIALNAAGKLKPKGIFIYITCSVFECENETIVSQIMHQHPHLKRQEGGIINGINDQADCMYYTIFSN